jgi:hypothetical protein
VLFVLVLFLSKNTTIFSNKIESSGLVYSGDEKVGDLIIRDTDGDGVSDWQEGLFGTDPSKKDTNGDGISDKVEIAKMQGQVPVNGELNLDTETTGDLNNTDQLSRELFSTIATLNQTGVVDQATIDMLSDSLADRIQNSSNKAPFELSNLKIIRNDTVQDVKKYSDALDGIYAKQQTGQNVFDVLDKFIIDEETADANALLELDPIIKKVNDTVSAMSKMAVPESLAPLHLEVLNTVQRLSENISNMKYYDTDIVLAMNGITQYGINADNLETVVNKLANAINQRLK